MTPPHPLLIRLAVAIEARYASSAVLHLPIQPPYVAWEACLSAHRLLEHARRRCGPTAAAQMQARFLRACRSVAHELGRLDEQLHPRTPRQTPCLRDLYAELIALYDDFEIVRIDRRAKTVAVTTDPIELEGINLGPFEIQLRWNDLPKPHCYSVVALQPHVSGGDGYVHPHVLNEYLCEGEGRLPLERAVSEGRLSDFFQIVARILQTYNAESAYIQLEDWDGQECSSCADAISESDSYDCSRCSDVLCSDCYERCSRCDETFCNPCVSPCSICEDVVCRGCLTTCLECEGDCCAKCRDDDERCMHCAAEAATPERDAAMDHAGSDLAGEAATTAATSATQTASAGGAPVAIHPHRLGEAAVPA